MISHALPFLLSRNYIEANGCMHQSADVLQGLIK